MRLIVAAAQYAGDSIEEIVRTGGPVRIARFRPDSAERRESAIQSADVDFIIRGRIRPI